MFRRAFIAVCATVLLAACSDLTSPNSAVGNYSLARVNGDALPILWTSTATEDVDLVGGTLDIRSNGSFLGTFTYRTTSSFGTSTSTDQFSGTWSESNAGTDVVLTVSGQGTVTATRSGNTLTVYDQGDTYVYQR